MEKTFTKLSILICCSILLAGFSTSLFAQGQRSFVKPIEVGTNDVLFDLPGEITVNEWDNDFVMITATVDLLNASDDILKRLFLAGRYTIQSTDNDDGSLSVTMPKLEIKVTMRGVTLEEKIRYEVSVPAKTPYEVITPEVISDGVK